MDFVPEKSALEVNEIREGREVAGASLHDQAAKVRVQRVLSKMQTVKSRLPSWRVKRRN
jgi:hypothetical protein